jgi:toxin ParE1/3/4
MALYKLSISAQEDLQRIWRHGLLHHGEAQADKYYYNFITRFEEIAEQPYLYPAVDDVHHGYRRSVCGIDNIYYRMVEGSVEIMAILGRQHTEKSL